MESINRRFRAPGPQGLYHPQNEHDACGMGLVASIRGEKSHEIIRKGLEVLINLTHRGAAGCDPETGDGAGILIQIPHAFFVRECGEIGMKLPDPGTYGVAMCFLPVERHSRLQCEGVFERIAKEEGLGVLGWRDTPVNGDAIGRVARNSQPYIEQLFVSRPAEMDEDTFERLLYRVRRRTENEIVADLASAMTSLAVDASLRGRLAANALEAARRNTWSALAADAYLQIESRLAVGAGKR